MAAHGKPYTAPGKAGAYPQKELLITKCSTLVGSSLTCNYYASLFYKTSCLNEEINCTEPSRHLVFPGYGVIRKH